MGLVTTAPANDGSRAALTAPHKQISPSMLFARAELEGQGLLTL